MFSKRIRNDVCDDTKVKRLFGKKKFRICLKQKDAPRVTLSPIGLRQSNFRRGNFERIMHIRRNVGEYNIMNI